MDAKDSHPYLDVKDSQFDLEEDFDLYRSTLLSEVDLERREMRMTMLRKRKLQPQNFTFDEDTKKVWKNDSKLLLKPSLAARCHDEMQEVRMGTCQELTETPTGVFTEGLREIQEEIFSQEDRTERGRRELSDDDKYNWISRPGQDWQRRRDETNDPAIPVRKYSKERLFKKLAFFRLDEKIIEKQKWRIWQTNDSRYGCLLHCWTLPVSCCPRGDLLVLRFHEGGWQVFGSDCANYLWDEIASILTDVCKKYQT